MAQRVVARGRARGVLGMQQLIQGTFWMGHLERRKEDAVLGQAGSGAHEQQRRCAAPTGAQVAQPGVNQFGAGELERDHGQGQAH